MLTLLLFVQITWQAHFTIESTGIAFKQASCDKGMATDWEHVQMNLVGTAMPWIHHSP